VSIADGVAGPLATVGQLVIREAGERYLQSIEVEWLLGVELLYAAQSLKGSVPDSIDCLRG
jgi:hypothetical protein